MTKDWFARFAVAGAAEKRAPRAPWAPPAENAQHGADLHAGTAGAQAQTARAPRAPDVSDGAETGAHGAHVGTALGTATGSAKGATKQEGSRTGAHGAHGAQVFDDARDAEAPLAAYRVVVDSIHPVPGPVRLSQAEVVRDPSRYIETTLIDLELAVTAKNAGRERSALVELVQ